MAFAGICEAAEFPGPSAHGSLPACARQEVMGRRTGPWSMIRIGSLEFQSTSWNPLYLFRAFSHHTRGERQLLRQPVTRLAVERPRTPMTICDRLELAMSQSGSGPLGSAFTENGQKCKSQSAKIIAATFAKSENRLHKCYLLFQTGRRAASETAQPCASIRYCAFKSYARPVDFGSGHGHLCTPGKRLSQSSAGLRSPCPTLPNFGSWVLQPTFRPLH